MPPALGVDIDRFSGTVLVLEDLPGPAALFVEHLQARGCWTVSIGGVKTLTANRIAGFDVLSELELDIDMHDLDGAWCDHMLLGDIRGAEVVKRLRAAGVPHIMGISSEQPSNAEMLAAGADSAILKAELIRALEQLRSSSL